MGIELLWHQFWEFSWMLRGAENRPFLLFFDAIKIENYMKRNLKMNKHIKLLFFHQKWVCRNIFDISCRIFIISFKNRNATVFSPIHSAYFQKRCSKFYIVGSSGILSSHKWNIFTYSSILFSWNCLFLDRCCDFFCFKLHLAECYIWITPSR